MVEVYGKKNCSQCDRIKKKLQDNNIKFSYYEEESITIKKAQELAKDSKLLEMTMPIILQKGEQIKHDDIEVLIRGNFNE